SLFVHKPISDIFSGPFPPPRHRCSSAIACHNQMFCRHIFQTSPAYRCKTPGKSASGFGPDASMPPQFLDGNALGSRPNRPRENHSISFLPHPTKTRPPPYLEQPVTDDSYGPRIFSPRPLHPRNSLIL